MRSRAALCSCSGQWLGQWFGQEQRSAHSASAVSVCSSTLAPASMSAGAELCSFCECCPCLQQHIGAGLDIGRSGARLILRGLSAFAAVHWRRPRCRQKLNSAHSASVVSVCSSTLAPASISAGAALGSFCEVCQCLQRQIGAGLDVGRSSVLFILRESSVFAAVHWRRPRCRPEPCVRGYCG